MNIPNNEQHDAQIKHVEKQIADHPYLTAKQIALKSKLAPALWSELCNEGAYQDFRRHLSNESLYEMFDISFLTKEFKAWLRTMAENDTITFKEASIQEFFSEKSDILDGTLEYNFGSDGIARITDSQRKRMNQVLSKKVLWHIQNEEQKNSIEKILQEDISEEEVDKHVSTACVRLGFWNMKSKLKRKIRKKYENKEERAEVEEKILTIFEEFEARVKDPEVKKRLGKNYIKHIKKFFYVILKVISAVLRPEEIDAIGELCLMLVDLRKTKVSELEAEFAVFTKKIVENVQGVLKKKEKKALSESKVAKIGGIFFENAMGMVSDKKNVNETPAAVLQKYLMAAMLKGYKSDKQKRFVLNNRKKYGTDLVCQILEYIETFEQEKQKQISKKFDGDMKTRGFFARRTGKRIDNEITTLPKITEDDVNIAQKIIDNKNFSHQLAKVMGIVARVGGSKVKGLKYVLTFFNVKSVIEEDDTFLVSSWKAIDSSLMRGTYNIDISKDTLELYKKEYELHLGKYNIDGTQEGFVSWMIENKKIAYV